MSTERNRSVPLRMPPFRNSMTFRIWRSLPRPCQGDHVGVRANRQGIVVMAYGKRLYLRQARDLALSLRLHGPAVPITLVTQWPHAASDRLFDVVLRIRGSPRRDCRPKLDLDLYTPFQRTMYIDSDGLAVRDPTFLFNRFADRDFAVLGRNISSGHWYGDVAAMCQRAASKTIPRFSGGFMYFADTQLAREIFRHAREMADNYSELGYDRFNGGVADEPLLSIALAQRGINAEPSMSDAAASLLDTNGTPSMDVLSGEAAFSKGGRTMAPAIVHFAGDHSSRWRRAGATYRRERRKLHRISRRITPTSARRRVDAGGGTE